jgi:hypothetical protein
VRAVAQRAEPGDVVGVDVRVDRLDQLEVELVDELQVAVDLLQDGIDDERLAAAATGQQVAVGAETRCRTAGGKSWLPPHEVGDEYSITGFRSGKALLRRRKHRPLRDCSNLRQTSFRAKGT